MKRLETEFIKVLRRDGGEKVIRRLVGACRDAADRLQPRYFSGGYLKLCDAVEAQVALLGALEEIQTAPMRRSKWEAPGGYAQ